MNCRDIIYDVREINVIDMILYLIAQYVIEYHICIEKYTIFKKNILLY